MYTPKPIKTPTIIDYLNLQKKYQLQYGERTVVLMQIGVFYEIYGYDPTYCTSEEAKVDDNHNVWNEAIGHAVELSIVLNSVLTHENGNDSYGIKNPHKVGFPMIAYEKNRDTLLANDYVIIRVDQVKGSKPVERFVAEVCSPTMQLDTIALTRPTSNIACIYIEYHQGARNRYDNFVITTGAAVVDVITGQNRVCEFYSKEEDQVCAVQELYRFLIVHHPRELIVHINDMPLGLDKHTNDSPNPYVKYLERVLELRRFDRLTTHVNTVPPDYKKLAYQIEFLNRLFTKQATQAQTQGMQLNIVQKRNDRIIEEIGLERMNYGRIAYMLLMQHCHSHNADIIDKLSKPDLQWLDSNRHLILTHNAIVQLDLVPSKGNTLRPRKKTEIDSLMSVLDHNQTHLGRRVLSTLLQNPMLDPNEIKTYYDMVDEMSTNVTETDVLWRVLDRQLKELPDVGRLQRKLEIKLITPKELTILYSAYVKIINIYVTIMQTKVPILQSQMLSKEDVDSFNSFLARFCSMINFEALEHCSVDTSVETNTKWLEFNDCPIRPGFYPELDEQTRALTAAEVALQQIVDHLNGFLTHTRGKKIEFKTAKKKQGAKKQDPTGTVLTTTSAKANELAMAQIDINLCGSLQVLPYTASDRIITSNRITALCHTIDGIKMWMRRNLISIYEAILQEMSTKYTFYVPIASLVAKLDLIHSYAKVANLYNYHRPDVIIDDADSSYLEATDIRHPIIERLIDGAYVTNDIFLGNGNNQRSNGMLLFGVNQTGKSSLAKAVALNIIMAQAGCFVSSTLRYKPYSKIITRISGNDNMFKAESSFAVEITELRTILRQSDESTLVIGDELCHGTETHSGMAITASALLSLIKNKSSFIFATHMHELLNLQSMRTTPSDKMRLCHLSISNDEISKSIIYDRKLRDGAGASVYGLMVAKSLDLPKDFLDQADEILLEITGQNRNIVEMVPSKYNNKVYVDSCVKCNRNKSQIELHTHHIIEQKHAGKNGIVDKIIKGDDGHDIDIGIIHKNAKDNLIVLCRDCHISLHSNKQELETVSTSNGKLIRVRPNTPSNNETLQLTMQQASA